nr:translation initiation factor IF-2-like [Symphalangus syndactylus]
MRTSRARSLRVPGSRVLPFPGDSPNYRNWPKFSISRLSLGKGAEEVLATRRTTTERATDSPRLGSEPAQPPPLPAVRAPSRAPRPGLHPLRRLGSGRAGLRRPHPCPGSEAGPSGALRASGLHAAAASAPAPARRATGGGCEDAGTRARGAGGAQAARGAPTTRGGRGGRGCVSNAGPRKRPARPRRRRRSSSPQARPRLARPRPPPPRPRGPPIPGPCRLRRARQPRAGARERPGGRPEREDSPGPAPEYMVAPPRGSGAEGRPRARATGPDAASREGAAGRTIRPGAAASPNSMADRSTTQRS